MAAKNRPMFCLSAMSSNLRAANLDPIDRSRVDASITTLVDLTGACERIFKSPVPLVYTRHTSRFLATFLLFLPMGIWPAMADSWNRAHRQQPPPIALAPSPSHPAHRFSTAQTGPRFR